jgi:opacity protein-like surface antigen
MKSINFALLQHLSKKLFLMKLKIAALFCIATVCFSISASAQYQSFRHEGEFGVQIGTAHYFGDLNPNARLNRPKLAGGIFFRKQVNEYVAVRIGANFAQLGYSDIYEKENEFRRRRNLSFNTNIWELAVQGDFNFFKFNPINPDERFTPYLTFGAGIVGFNPYAYLGTTKYFLQPLGTEGQGSPLYPDRSPYSTVALAFPIGLGVKFSITDRMNLNIEVAHRFTSTDYMDDVSGTYAGIAAFKPNSPAAILQDRSLETGPIIGTAGNQRGFGKQKDQYIMATVGLTFNFSSYKCPSSGL